MALSVHLSVRPSVRPSTIACERDILKTARRIDFTFWYGLNTTKTSDAIDLGHSTKTKMAATSVWRLILYPMHDIACEHNILKTACQIDFTFWYGLNTTKTSDVIDLGHSTKTKMAATAVYCLWTRYLENRLLDSLHILIRPYFQVVNLIPCKPRLCSEDRDNLHYALITFVLWYTPHSGDKALSRVIWVLRKPTRVFLLLYNPLNH